MPDYNLRDWQDVERAERNVARWLRERMGRQVFGHIASVFVMGPLTLLAAAAVVLGLGFLGIGFGLYVFGFLFAGVAVLVAFPVQYLRWRRGLTRVTLQGGGLAIDEDKPTPAILIQGSDNSPADSSLGDIVLFPATIAFMALRHAIAAWQLHRADPVLMAKVLTGLAHSGKRTTLHDIEMTVGDTRLPAVLKALRHWPGVLWFVRDQVALTVNDELRHEIAHQGGWRT